MPNEENTQAQDDAAKKSTLKGLIKEAVAELIDERAEKARTEKGNEKPKGNASIFDAFGI